MSGPVHPPEASQAPETRWDRARRGRGRLIWVFVLAILTLTPFVGRPLLAPSDAPHYAWLADAWLHGRLDLGDTPPGYPRAHNDWAVVTMLEVEPGQPARRAKRCRTSMCARLQARAGPRRSLWWVEGTPEPVVVDQGQVTRAATRWYVSFPPGPAALMLPWVALFGRAVPDLLLNLLLAAAGAAALVRTLDIAGEGPRDRHLWLAAAWLLGGPATFVGSHGGVWFTAQLMGGLCLTMGLSAWLQRGVGPRAGIWFALACACRPHLGLAVPILLLAQLRRRIPRPVSAATLLGCALPLTAMAVALVGHNMARFGDPLEFGHGWLDVRWQQRMQEVGMFSPDYLVRNLRCLLLLPFELQMQWPWIKISIHGLGLVATSAWVFLALWPPRDPGGRRIFWTMSTCAVTVAALPLLYHNSGQLQVTYRFALDWLPFIAVGAASALPRFPRLERWIILGAIAVNLHLCFAFSHHTARLFVTSPMGWPFEGELGSS